MMTWTGARTRYLSALIVAASLSSCGGSTRPAEPVLVTALPGTTPQTGPIGTSVASPPGVRVIGADGSGLANVDVRFVVASGGGSVVGGTTKTDASGVARVTSWTLGPTAGENTLTATVSGVPNVTFTASALGHPVAAAMSNRVSGIGGRPFAVRVSVDGAMAVTQQDLNSVTFTTASNGSPRTATVGLDPGDVVFNSAGNRAYVSAFNGGNVTVIDVVNAVPIATIPIAANAYRLALTPDDSKLFVTSTDGHVYVVNLVSLVVTPLTLKTGLHGAALDGAGQFLFVTATSGAVWKIDASTLSVIATSDVGGTPQDVAVAPNGSEIYVANELGWVDVLDASTLVSRRRITDVGAPFGLAVSPDGAFLYQTSSVTGELNIIDVATRAVVKTIAVGGVPRRVAFDRFGLSAVIANENNYVDVIK